MRVTFFYFFLHSACGTHGFELLGLSCVVVVFLVSLKSNCSDVYNIWLFHSGGITFLAAKTETWFRFRTDFSVSVCGCCLYTTYLLFLASLLVYLRMEPKTFFCLLMLTSRFIQKTVTFGNLQRQIGFLASYETNNSV